MCPISPVAHFVPQETQHQGELPHFVKGRKSAGCIQEEIKAIHLAEKGVISEGDLSSHPFSSRFALLWLGQKGLCIRLLPCLLCESPVYLALCSNTVFLIFLLVEPTVENPGVQLLGCKACLHQYYLVTLDKLSKPLLLLLSSGGNDSNSLKRCFLKVQEDIFFVISCKYFSEFFPF